NPDPGLYKAYEQFTTAHENDRAGHYANTRQFDPPVEPNDHARLQLWLSLSKHGTYHFDPDGRIVLNLWLHIAITIATFLPLIFAFFSRSHPYLYLTLFIITHIIVNTCIAETFHEQGAQLPADMINVGEPGRPINASSFIEAPKLRDKLTGPPHPAP